eukprot:UN1871
MMMGDCIRTIICPSQASCSSVLSPQFLGSRGTQVVGSERIRVCVQPQALMEMVHLPRRRRVKHGSGVNKLHPFDSSQMQFSRR